MKSTDVNKKWFFIVNPAAGSGTVKRRWEHISYSLREANIDFNFTFTREKKDAIKITQQAIENGYRKIIGVGGDGTCHEVANGIMLQKILPSDKITFALLPIGTGNDWIKTWKIPKKLNAWIKMLKAEKTTLQDVGVIYFSEDGKPQKRFFINVAGMAYDAFVVRYSESQKRLASNQFFYLWLILRCLFKYKVPTAKIEFDGTIIEQKVHTINVGICRYSGGGMQIVPHAEPTDGLMALTTAKPFSKISVILNTWRFYTGSIGQLSKVQLSQTKEVKVEAVNGEILLEADGEFLGTVPARFSILKKSLKIIVP